MLTKKELENTYLKYSEDITEEVFDKICNRLKQLGIPECYEGNETYKYFTDGYPYIKIDKDYQVASNDRGYTQIQVLDILGDDWNKEDKSNIKFDELSYGDWLVETRKLNLSLKELSNHIASPSTCHYDNHYAKLAGKLSADKAKILYEKWYKEDKEEPKFEVGKWYYFESYSNKVPNIVKCDRLTNNTIKTKNWIMLRHKKITDEGEWLFEELSNIREVSLEEIQQYLPEGHPDLISNTKKFVYCKNKEEWDFVVAKLGYKYNSLQYEPKYECISLKNQYYLLPKSDLNDKPIYSFEEWCKVNNYTFKTNKIMDKEELLAEAKRRYPVGTTYWNLDLAGGRSNKHEGAKPHTINSEGEPFVEREDFKGLGPVIARGSLNGYVYSGGKWAEIVSKPESNFKFEIGDEVDVIEGCQACCMADLSTSIKPTLIENQIITDRKSNKDGNWYLFDSWGNWYTEEGLVLSKDVKSDEPKESIEKWSEGTYVVIIQPKEISNTLIEGEILTIKAKPNDLNCLYKFEEKDEAIAIDREDDNEIKWFATYNEAKEFSDNLLNSREDESFLYKVEFKIGMGIREQIETIGKSPNLLPTKKVKVYK